MGEEQASAGSKREGPSEETIKAFHVVAEEIRKRHDCTPGEAGAAIHEAFVRGPLKDVQLPISCPSCGDPVKIPLELLTNTQRLEAKLDIIAAKIGMVPVENSRTSKEHIKLKGVGKGVVTTQMCKSCYDTLCGVDKLPQIIRHLSAPALCPKCGKKGRIVEVAK